MLVYVCVCVGVCVCVYVCFGVCVGAWMHNIISYVTVQGKSKLS